MLKILNGRIEQIKTVNKSLNDYKRLLKDGKNTSIKKDIRICSLLIELEKELLDLYN